MYIRYLTFNSMHSTLMYRNVYGTGTILLLTVPTHRSLPLREARTGKEQSPLTSGVIYAVMTMRPGWQASRQGWQSSLPVTMPPPPLQLNCVLTVHVQNMGAHYCHSCGCRGGHRDPCRRMIYEHEWRNIHHMYGLIEILLRDWVTRKIFLKSTSKWTDLGLK